MSNSRDIADSAATINFIDTVTSNVQTQLNTLNTAIGNISVTSGTLTQTFTNGQVSTISLTSSVLAPVVTVTKEVSQSGSTNNTWDVNSTSQNYTRLDSAPATTLSWAGGAVNNASFVDSFSVASQEGTPRGMAFSADGTKMFVVGDTGDDVNEYALTTAFDVSTSSFTDSFYINAQDPLPNDVAFNTDGTKMFVLGKNSDTVYAYTLTTGFDVSTASYSSVSFSVTAQDTQPAGMAFNTDGTKMFIVGYAGQDINEYALTTGFDISTASFTDSFSVASQETEPYGVAFNSNGTKMFVVGNNVDTVFQYTLTTGFDVSTASYDSISYSVASQDNTVVDVEFNPTGDKMFIVGLQNDSIYEYTIPLALQLGTGSFASGDVGKTIEANSGVFVLTATTGTYSQTTAPSSYAQVASGSWEMFGTVYNTTDGDLELSNYNPAWNVSVSEFVDSYDLSANETQPRAVAWTNDGSKYFIVGGTGLDVGQYGVSTNFDVSTSTYEGAFSISAQGSNPRGMCFNSDGTKMFIVELTAGVNEYALPAPFTVGGPPTYTRSFSLSSQDSTPDGIAFNADGTKMFITGQQNDKVYEYALSTGFDVSTASFTDGFSVASQDPIPHAVSFSTDGTKMFVVGRTSPASVYQYTLTTGFDVSTASYASISFDVSSQEIYPFGMAFNSDGTKLFITGNAGDDINEYSLGSLIITSGYQPVHTTTSTNTTYWTDINSMTADQAAGSGNVYYCISTDDRTTWSVIDNTSGERDIVRNNSGTWQYNSNGTYASETWTAGTTNTELATLAEAMEGASSVAGQFDISTAVYSQAFSFAAQEDTPEGLAFSPDGTKMFVVGRVGQDVNEYTLTTGFDVSSASYTRNFSVSAQDINPYDLTFNTDGTKMFVTGGAYDKVSEYVLSTGFNLSTASYSQDFSVISQEAFPFAIAFNNDGTKMFIGGAGSVAVNEYTLSTGFDVSTASFVDAFSVSAQITSLQGIAFNSDGTEMFIVDSGTDNVFKYTLTTGFDVSTASYSSVSFSVASQDGNAQGIAFDSNGTKMFIVGQINDSVYEYSVGTTVYTNQMDKTQLDAVTDPNHIVLGSNLDLSIILNLTSGTTAPSSNGVSINYDANVLNKAAVLGTDYDFDAPAQNKVRITALAANNLKIRVL